MNFLVSHHLMQRLVRSQLSQRFAVVAARVNNLTFFPSSSLMVQRQSYLLYSPLPLPLCQLLMEPHILVSVDLPFPVANLHPKEVQVTQRCPQLPRGWTFCFFSTFFLYSHDFRAFNPRTRVDDRAVIQVLQNVAQRVTDEAESQFVATSPPKQEMHALVKQKHVLEQTVNAYDRALSGHGHLQARRLAVAAQHVVLQAAQTIVADRTVGVGGATTSEMESVSLHELTDKTQDAIAMAVKMNGPTSNEVDIIVTATSILKQATTVTTPPPPSMNSRMAGPTTPRTSAFPLPTSLSTLPEHG